MNLFLRIALRKGLKRQPRALRCRSQVHDCAARLALQASGIVDASVLVEGIGGVFGSAGFIANVAVYGADPVPMSSEAYSRSLNSLRVIAIYLPKPTKNPPQHSFAFASWSFGHRNGPAMQIAESLGHHFIGQLIGVSMTMGLASGGRESSTNPA